MKVLMFGWEFPPHNSGGLGVACQGLCRALVAKGVDLTFVLPKQLGNINEPFKIIFANIPDVNALTINSLLTPYLTSEAYGQVYADTLFEEVRRYALLAGGLAKNGQYDFIHAHDWLSFSAAISAKKAIHKPFIAHIHATEVDRTAGKVNQYIFDREREGFQAADKVISVSEYVKNTLHDYYGISGNKVSVVHNGIEPSHYHLKVKLDQGFAKLKALGYKVVLFLGRITIMKGPDYFVAAAHRVLEYNPKVIFVIVGAGDLEGQIMNQVARLGISDKFLFPGFLRGIRKSRIFRSADLFVMPSVSEPFGLVPLESLLHQTPVIISRQSGVSEVLHHALKVDFWDTEELADQILSCLKYKSLRNVLQKNGTKEALLCNWDAAAQKCLEVYKNV